jgi:hypothetical protein
VSLIAELGKYWCTLHIVSVTVNRVVSYFFFKGSVCFITLFHISHSVNILITKGHCGFMDILRLNETKGNIICVKSLFCVLHRVSKIESFS